MKIYSGLCYFLLGAIATLLVLTNFSFRNSAHADEQRMWLPPALPAQLSFAAEPVPLQRWDVKERFERELLLNYYSQGNIIYLLKLANRNFPIISEHLKAGGVPDDFKYLCIAESNMQSWAASKAGAIGYWQFMNGTGPGYGLIVNDEVDQRMDLARSTDAACKYFRAAYEKFGNWTAAAASYNCGMGGFNNQAGFQGSRNYYDLQLPEETNKYLYRILTFKYLLEHADELGFVVKDEEKFSAVPARSVTITSSIPNLAEYARQNGTTYKMLRVLNPWIKGRSLTIHGNTYILQLPIQKSF